MTSLKPCPFCGKTPNEDSYYQSQGYKYGGIRCCIQGPEVRTSYADWPAWKEAAIKAWNERANEANGKPVKAEAKIKELTEALEFQKNVLLRALEVNARLMEALTPSAGTKRAYMSEFTIRTPKLNHYGSEYVSWVDVPWITIKEIMRAIRKKAGAE